VDLAEKIAVPRKDASIVFTDMPLEQLVSFATLLQEAQGDDLKSKTVKEAMRAVYRQRLAKKPAAAPAQPVKPNPAPEAKAVVADEEPV
jgi:hypothetical protein